MVRPLPSNIADLSTAFYARSSFAGVILCSVVSSDPAVSPFMLVLDAKTFTEVARASIPASVHLDLHGLFIPASV